MENRDKNSGFTLIEIIVVLIIVGILAGIALPNLFGNVQKSRAAEALSNIATFRPVVEGCIMKASGVNDDTSCDTAQLGNPVSTTNFTYALTGPANGTDTGYSIVASGQGALQNTDTLTVTRPAAVWPNISSTITCAGVNQLSGVC